MLCISRRSGESVLLPDGCKITVLSAGPGRVRLGFVAPKDIAIMREEIVQETDELLTAHYRDMGGEAGTG